MTKAHRLSLPLACLVLCAAAAFTQAIDTGGAGRRSLLQAPAPPPGPAPPPAPAPAPAKTPDAQKQVLLNTREQFAGGDDGMAILDTWNEENSMCPEYDPYSDQSSGGFYGIECNDAGLVTKISMTYNLDGLLLTGELPAAWGALTSLTDINIAGRGAFLGTLPAAGSALVNLAVLYIQLASHYLPEDSLDAERDAGISGPLPASWGPKMKKLLQLELANQAFSGPLPASWAGMKELATLNLAGNKLTGQLPAGWSALTSLRIPDVSRNQLKGPIPATYAKLKNVMDIILSNNQFSGVVPTWLASLSNLGRLELDNNKFSGKIPAELFTKAYIDNVAVSKNPNLAGCIPRAAQDKGVQMIYYRKDVQYYVRGVQPDVYDLSEYYLVKNQGPLQGTKITGLCA